MTYFTNLLGNILPDKYIPIRGLNNPNEPVNVINKFVCPELIEETGRFRSRFWYIGQK